MFKDMRFIRALMYLYLGTAVGLGALLLCMSFALTSSPALSGSAVMTLVPIAKQASGYAK